MSLSLSAVCVSGEAFEQSPIQRSFKSKVLVHYPESTDRNPFNKDAVNMVNSPLACKVLSVIYLLLICSSDDKEEQDVPCAQQQCFCA